MSTQWRSIQLVVSVITLAVAVFWLSSAPVLAQSNDCNTNDPGAPCFANNPDILGGEQARNLERTDDLTLLKVTPGGQPTNEFIQWRLNTTNSILATPSKLLQLSVSGSTPVVAVGRMFNVDRDTTVTILNSLGAYFMTIAERQNEVQGDSGRFKATNLVMADFTGDGFADLFTTGINQGFGPSMRIVTAQDVNTPFALKFGPLAQLDPVFRMTVGDFNGDGRPEVAGLINNNGAYALGIYTVDPTTLTIERAAFLRLNGEAISVAAGRFGTLNYDQLVILSNPPGGKCCVVQAYDFNRGVSTQSALQPDPKGSNNALITTPSRLFSGSFIPGVYQQVLSPAVFQQGSANRVIVGLLTFSRDGKLTPTLVGDSVSSPAINFGCIHDMAVGNFNRQIRINNKDQYDPRLNFAVAGTDCGSNTRVQVFTVNTDTQGTDVTYTSPQTLSFNSGAIPAGTFFRLAAGDLQGRSIPLGQPDKLTITNRIQPDTILGVPPMHVDWITPADGEEPSILNVSVFPQTFNTGYNFANQTDTRASNKTTTSYATAFKGTVEGKYTVGLGKISEVSVGFKTSFEKQYERTVDKTYNTYQGQSFNLKTQTVFDDLVASTASRLNIYSYPVLGQCVDRPGAPPLDHCPAGKAPLHVLFSGSDNVQYINLVEGRGLEWYQPVHEPGQIFSYPGSLAQLRAEQPNVGGPGTESSLQLLSSSNNFWGWSAIGEESIKWEQGGETGGSTGTIEGWTSDSSISFAYNAWVGPTGGAQLDLSISDATNTLKASSSTYSASTGVLLNRGISGGPTTSANYLYEGQAFIFGQTAHPETLHKPIPPNTVVKAQGFLSVGYAANPMSTVRIQSGDFWKLAYSVPDVALNHPQRWLQRAELGGGADVQFNCPIGFTSAFDQPCIPRAQAPTPVNVALALFYRMKGLFVTTGATAQGPTTAQATQGDTVTLRARVYNYSLANMPEDTRVRVQFYAQPWDSRCGAFLSEPPANPCNKPNAFARAEFIGEDVLDPIPAFCGGPSRNPQEDPCTKSDAPRNWTFAQTEWDTSKVPANTNWKFWVVVWMEDSNGQKVAEIEDHGLTAIPNSSRDNPLPSLADVPIETYSNNLGVYNQVFHVGPKAGVLQASARSQHLMSRWENLPKGGALQADQVLTLGASHHVVGADVDNVMVLFYDGDPEQGGQLFDMELIPHIAANENFVTRVPYSPEVCGPHQLFVQAIPMDGAAPTTTDVSAVTVACP